MSAAKDIKYFFLNSLLTSIIFGLLYLYAKTLRVKIEDAEKIQKHLENGGRILFSSWHQRLFGGFFIPKVFKWTPCIMISQSRDGDFISKVVSYIGWIPVRGSSSRGGRQALRAMIQGLLENPIGCHIVDGPNGPPRIIKPGLLALARSADALICLGIISYEKAWVANSWDRFLIPKPFSRVLVRFGSTYSVPKKMSTDQFEPFRKEIEDEMIKEYEAADNGWAK